MKVCPCHDVIARLAESGMKNTAISSKLGVPLRTVQKVVKQWDEEGHFYCDFRANVQVLLAAYNKAEMCTNEYGMTDEYRQIFLDVNYKNRMIVAERLAKAGRPRKIENIHYEDNLGRVSEHESTEYTKVNETIAANATGTTVSVMSHNPTTMKIIASRVTLI
ncbi:hypothetical protein ANCCEY_07671 [Ancylostoma ceylanicum]|uniref:Uncharacterized protein n=1 Tax=Ancylostoma ceylanicum TaxID=53326 RepID=A0A0D6LT61_9BILA|nr:hypothetical protein ANCCEY_07671 [Ancylostoma ceylanicum]